MASICRNSFAGHPEALTDFFQRVIPAVEQPKTQLQYLPFPFVQEQQRAPDLIPQEFPGSGIQWGHHAFVLDEIPEDAAFLGTYRSLERHGLLRQAEDFFHPLHGAIQFLFQGGRERFAGCPHPHDFS